MMANTPFKLDPRLAQSSLDWGQVAPALNLRLANDSRWPWLILVPQIEGIIELDDLPPDMLATLMQHTARLAKALRHVTGGTKTNIATLGNMVNQFHLHIVARKAGDPAWPGPIWGYGQAVPYQKDEAQKLRQALMQFEEKE